MRLCRASGSASKFGAAQTSQRNADTHRLPRGAVRRPCVAIAVLLTGFVSAGTRASPRTPRVVPAIRRCCGVGCVIRASRSIPSLRVASSHGVTRIRHLLRNLLPAPQNATQLRPSPGWLAHQRRCCCCAAAAEIIAAAALSAAGRARADVAATRD